MKFDIEIIKAAVYSGLFLSGFFFFFLGGATFSNSEAMCKLFWATESSLFFICMHLLKLFFHCINITSTSSETESTAHQFALIYKV